jgi:hypothetical protein
LWAATPRTKAPRDAMTRGRWKWKPFPKIGYYRRETASPSYAAGPAAAYNRTPGMQARVRALSRSQEISHE